MFLISLNAEIVACILSFRKSRNKPNLESTSKYGFSPDLGGKNGGVLSMRMQVILDSSFARPGLAPIWGGKKGEFRDWTTVFYKMIFQNSNKALSTLRRRNLKTQLYFYVVRPSVHTNPSRKRSFSKTLFKSEEFGNAGFSFSCGPKTF